MTTTPELWHYTSPQAAKEIDKIRAVFSAWVMLGHRMPVDMRWRAGLVWATDLHPLPPGALGYPSRPGPNDHTAVAYRVVRDHLADFVPWLSSPARAVEPEQSRYVEDEPDAMPAHWWVASRHVVRVETPGRRLARGLLD